MIENEGIVFMNLASLAYSGGLQNVHAPLPLPAHLIFCALATLLYAVQFQRRGMKHYIYLLLAVDLTIITQFFDQSYVIIALAVAEAILLIMAFISSTKSKKELKKQEEEKERKNLVIQGEIDAEKFKVDLNKISDDSDSINDDKSEE